MNNYISFLAIKFINMVLPTNIILYWIKKKYYLRENKLKYLHQQKLDLIVKNPDFPIQEYLALLI